MAGPYFMAKPVIEKHDIAVFSSNYNLYGDLSWRVMETLRMMLGKRNVEVYSVDEAFLDLSIFPENELQTIAEEIKKTVETWTGIKVSVGVAPTKVLAKVANRLSKKYIEKYKGVMVLRNEEEINSALKQTQIGDVWGVGRQYAEKLKQHFCIYDALQLFQFCAVQLQGIVNTLPWIATVDAFQHWVYENPAHSRAQRSDKWNELVNRFGMKLADYTGYENALTYSWHKQLHIFEIPFYYIEYGFAQLGAIGMWKLFKTNKTAGLKQYKAALEKGYTITIPEVYKTAGLSFNFSGDYVKELFSFVGSNMMELD